MGSTFGTIGPQQPYTAQVPSQAQQQQQQPTQQQRQAQAQANQAIADYAAFNNLSRQQARPWNIGGDGNYFAAELVGLAGQDLAGYQYASELDLSDHYRQRQQQQAVATSPSTYTSVWPQYMNPQVASGTYVAGIGPGGSTTYPSKDWNSTTTSHSMGCGGRGANTPSVSAVSAQATNRSRESGRRSQMMLASQQPSVSGRQGGHSTTTGPSRYGYHRHRRTSAGERMENEETSASDSD